MASALQADVFIGPDEKSAFGVARDGDRLAVRGPKSGACAQQDKPLAVRDDGVRGAIGTRVAELDASAKGVGGSGKEGLAGAGSDLPSEM
jgi:hypothetical protein